MEQRARNKRLIPIVAIAASAAVFAASAYAASGNLSAYNSFKETLLNSAKSSTELPANFTQNMQTTVRYDGETVISEVSVNKYQGENTWSSQRTITSNGSSESIEQWSWVADGKYHSVHKESNSSVYEHSEYPYVDTSTYDSDDYDYEYGATSAQQKFMNALVDTLMGDTKNFFTYDSGYINLNLEGSQIPELIQLGVAMVMEEASNTSISGYGGAYSNHPELTQMLKLMNVRLESINIRMKEGESVADWTRDVSFSASISGQDANGIRHTLEVEGTTSCDQIGNTVADTIDLTGKQVREMANEDYSITFNDGEQQVRIDQNGVVQTQ